MGGGGGDRKLCDSCKSSPANLFCRADAAFLCNTCDARVHAANKLASRHARVGMCDVCEHEPAAVTCKADAAALCVTCDRDIHSANPLARRHERVPVIPFYESADKSSIIIEDRSFFDQHPDNEEEEAEAASWLLPNPNLNKIADDLDFDHDHDHDYHSTYPIGPYFVKEVKVDTNNSDKHEISHFQYSCGNDGVVPVHVTNNNNNNNNVVHQQHGSVVDGFPAYDVEYSGSKPFMYNFSSQSISQSVSSSSLDVGVVPDHNALAEVSNCLGQNPAPAQVPDNAPLTGMDREARVLRYREKRKNRKFEKTIRYASRKAYAETRPRIKGRFAKRSEMDVGDLLACDAGYGVVPSY